MISTPEMATISTKKLINIYFFSINWLGTLKITVFNF